MQQEVLPFSLECNQELVIPYSQKFAKGSVHLTYSYPRAFVRLQVCSGFVFKQKFTNKLLFCSRNALLTST